MRAVRIVAFLVGIGAPAIVTGFSLYLQFVVMASPHRGPFQVWMWDNKVILFVVLGISSVVGQVIAKYAGGRYRRIRFILEQLHERGWQADGQKDPTHRVSYYFRSRWGLGRYLECYYRTDGITPKERWRIHPRKPPPRPPGKIVKFFQTVIQPTYDSDSVAAHVWRTGLLISVVSPPANPSAEDLAKYHATTMASPALVRSWKLAAMLGVPVTTSSDGIPIAVLMVECSSPGKKIEISSLNMRNEAKICGMIWEGQLS